MQTDRQTDRQTGRTGRTDMDGQDGQEGQDGQDGQDGQTESYVYIIIQTNIHAYLLSRMWTVGG